MFVGDGVESSNSAPPTCRLKFQAWPFILKGEMPAQVEILESSPGVLTEEPEGWNPLLGLRGKGTSKAHSLSAPKSHNRAIASDFRVDGAKSPEFPQKDWVLG